MKTEEKPEKEFHTVAFFRKIKEQIALELVGKSFEEQKELLRKFLDGEIKLIV